MTDVVEPRDERDPLPEPVFIAGTAASAYDFARRNGVARWRNAELPGAMFGAQGGTLVLVHGYDPTRRDIFTRAKLHDMRIITAVREI